MSDQTFRLTNIVKLSDEDASIALLERAVLGLLEAVNDLTRFRRTTRQNYRVTIFGSARIQAATAVYEDVKKLAAELTSMGCDILTGGGSSLMQAADEGAHPVDSKGLRRSIGINIELPLEQQENSFVSQAYAHRTFFSRLHHFKTASDAVVVAPGGIGSLLEMSLAWQLLQVRKLYDMPLVLVEKMWTELVAWARRTMLIEGSELASDANFAIPQCVITIEETVALIEENCAAWLGSQQSK